MLNNWPHSNQRNFHWGTIKPLSRGDISWELERPHLHCFRSGFYNWQQYFWTFHFHYFVNPRPARKIILGSPLRGCMSRTVTSHNRLPLLAERPSTREKVKGILQRMNWKSLVSATWNKNAAIAISQIKESKRENSPRSQESTKAWQTTTKVKMVLTWEKLAKCVN